MKNLKSKSISYLQKMLRFLVKHGKKSVMEKNVYKYLKFKTNKNNKSFKDLLEQTMHKSIPYVNLKMRRKGRTVLYKVADISNQKAEKQSLLFFSKFFRQQHRDKFSIKFEKELEKTFSEKNIGTEKRDEIHQKALKYLDIETEDTEEPEEVEEISVN